MFPCLLLIAFICFNAIQAHTSTSADIQFQKLYGFGTSNPRLTSYPLPKAQTSLNIRRNLEGGKPTLKANVSSISGTTTHVSVHYNDVEFTSANDWIGMWPITDHYSLFSAPIKFKFVCEECRHAPPGPPWPPSPAPNGTLEFTLINRRLPVVFIYVHGSSQFPESLARSQNITVDNPQIPQGGHLSLVRSDPTKMRLQWSSDPTTDPHVKYGTKSGHYDKRTECCNGTDDDEELEIISISMTKKNKKKNNIAKTTGAAQVPYTKSDMCDTDVQPAGLHGWYPPPSNHTAIFDTLIPKQTYYYIYGSDEGGWSDEKIFHASPKTSSKESTIIAAFGDMGNVEIDGSYHHSWDFGDRGEIPSSNTTQRIAQEKDIDMVLHIGDISYACGFLSEWDNFFNMIEPVATTIPWMTAIGNHEQGWSKSSPFPGTDSGGECGVPYNAYFPFASQNPSSSFPQREPWYDYTYGNVHTIVFSTEHDFSKGSSQYEWLETTLKSVDRSVTPWLMIAGHRPMYVDTGWHVADVPLRAALEAMFQKYKVDVAIWGHNHSYQRSCSVNNMTCVDEKFKKEKCRALKKLKKNNNTTQTDVVTSHRNHAMAELEKECSTHGIQHFVIGMAGYAMNPIPEEKADFMVVTKNDTWGYLKMEFLSETVLKTTFISDLDGSVVDTFTLDKTE